MLSWSNKDGLQISYGNQALILQAWGRLEETLALHKKQEALCLEREAVLLTAIGLGVFSRANSVKTRGSKYWERTSALSPARTRPIRAAFKANEAFYSHS